MALGAVLLAASARGDVLQVPQDFEFIQDAIDAAQPGDEIVVAAGSYAGLLAIDGKTDLRLRGKGKVELLGSVPDEPNVAVTGSSGIVLERLRITGSEGDGLLVLDSSDVTIRHCRIEQSAERGLLILGGSQHLVQHLEVVDSGESAVHASGAQSVTLSHCSVSGTGQHGLLLQNGTGHLVEHASVEDTALAGILLDNEGLTTLTGTIVRKSVVRNSGGDGLVLEGTGLLIEHNRVFDAGGSGLAALGAFESLVRNNRVVDAIQHGITLGTTCEVRDNRLIRCGAHGLVSNAGSQVLIGNRVIEPALDGITLGAASVGCTLVDNRVQVPGQDGIVVAGDDTQLLDNRVTAALRDGFSVEATSCVFLGNKAKDSVNFDLNDQSGFANTYVDNDFGTLHFD